MDQDEDVSLFIGCLPGGERRQIVLFPGGDILADIHEEDIETPRGDWLADGGWTAANALIGALTNGGGWYIEDVTDDANGWWLKPRREPSTSLVRFRTVDATPGTGEAGGSQP